MILLILVAFEMKFISLKNITTRQNKHAFLFYRLTFWWKASSRHPKLTSQNWLVRLVRRQIRSGWQCHRFTRPWRWWALGQHSHAFFSQCSQCSQCTRSERLNISFLIHDAPYSEVDWNANMKVSSISTTLGPEKKSLRVLSELLSTVPAQQKDVTRVVLLRKSLP